MSDYLVLIAASLLTCAGQLCQKRAAQQPLTSKKMLLCWLLLALLFMGCGLLSWLRVLQFLPLSTAYPMLSLNFIVIAMASRILFDEQIGRSQWLGIAFIMLGVSLIGIG